MRKFEIAVELDGYDTIEPMTEQELKELLTPEFLSTLHTAVECCNWDVDMIESIEFCKWCYSMVGKRCPNFNVDFEMEATK